MASSSSAASAAAASSSSRGNVAPAISTSANSTRDNGAPIGDNAGSINNDGSNNVIFSPPSPKKFSGFSPKVYHFLLQGSALLVTGFYSLDSYITAVWLQDEVKELQTALLENIVWNRRVLSNRPSKNGQPGYSLSKLESQIPEIRDQLHLMDENNWTFGITKETRLGPALYLAASNILWKVGIVVYAVVYVTFSRIFFGRSSMLWFLCVEFFLLDGVFDFFLELMLWEEDKLKCGAVGMATGNATAATAIVGGSVTDNSGMYAQAAGSIHVANDGLNANIANLSNGNATAGMMDPAACLSMAYDDIDADPYSIRSWLQYFRTSIPNKSGGIPGMDGNQLTTTDTFAWRDYSARGCWIPGLDYLGLPMIWFPGFFPLIWLSISGVASLLDGLWGWIGSQFVTYGIVPFLILGFLFFYFIEQFAVIGSVMFTRTWKAKVRKQVRTSVRSTVKQVKRRASEWEHQWAGNQEGTGNVANARARGISEDNSIPSSSSNSGGFSGFTRRLVSKFDSLQRNLSGLSDGSFADWYQLGEQKLEALRRRIAGIAGADDPNAARNLDNPRDPNNVLRTGNQNNARNYTIGRNNHAYGTPTDSPSDSVQNLNAGPNQDVNTEGGGLEGGLEGRLGDLGGNARNANPIFNLNPESPAESASSSSDGVNVSGSSPSGTVSPSEESSEGEMQGVPDNRFDYGQTGNYLSAQQGSYLSAQQGGNYMSAQQGNATGSDLFLSSYPPNNMGDAIKQDVEPQSESLLEDEKANGMKRVSRTDVVMGDTVGDGYAAELDRDGVSEFLREEARKRAASALSDRSDRDANGIANTPKDSDTRKGRESVTEVAEVSEERKDEDANLNPSRRARTESTEEGTGNESLFDAGASGESSDRKRPPSPLDERDPKYQKTKNSPLSDHFFQPSADTIKENDNGNNANFDINANGSNANRTSTTSTTSNTGCVTLGARVSSGLSSGLGALGQTLTKGIGSISQSLLAEYHSDSENPTENESEGGGGKSVPNGNKKRKANAQARINGASSGSMDVEQSAGGGNNASSSGGNTSAVQSAAGAAPANVDATTPGNAQNLLPDIDWTAPVGNDDLSAVLPSSTESRRKTLADKNASFFDRRLTGDYSAYFRNMEGNGANRRRTLEAMPLEEGAGTAGNGTGAVTGRRRDGWRQRKKKDVGVKQGETAKKGEGGKDGEA